MKILRERAVRRSVIQHKKQSIKSLKAVVEKPSELLIPFADAKDELASRIPTTKPKIISYHSKNVSKEKFEEISELVVPPKITNS